MKKPLSNYQDFLKTLAIIAVYIDHTGLFFVDNLTLRAFGRFAMPIFCFFVGYNYSKPNKIRLVYFGSVITILYAVCFNIYLVNLLIVMYTGHWYLYFINKYNFQSSRDVWIQIILLLGIMPFSYQYFEYGTLAIAYILVGYLSRRGINDYRMLCLLTIESIFIHQYLFKWDLLNGAISIIVFSVASYLLWSQDHYAHTKWDFRLISRNSIFLYFLNLVVSILYLRFVIL